MSEPETTSVSKLSSETLMGKVYTQLRRLAAHQMSGQAPGQTLQATALVHEAWLKLSKKSPEQWRDTHHFYATAADAMRQILIDRARRRQALRHGGKVEKADIDGIEIAAPARDETLLKVNDALDELAKIDPQKAELVNMRFFVGLSERDIAKIMNVSERTIERRWAHAKAWLFERIEQSG